jgi:hypothetical protein
MTKSIAPLLSLTVKSLLAAMERSLHIVFEGELSLNIIAVRHEDTNANTFNDTFCVLYKRKNKWELEQFKCTTDPGLYYRENPCNVDGTAIVAPGQHRSLWTFGNHQGKYPALVQNKPVTVFRDANGDEKIDAENAQIKQRGYFGINCHRASAKHESKQVDKWSAGCQVFANPSDFETFMALCNESAETWGNTFTYTLLTQDQLNGEKSPSTNK